MPPQRGASCAIGELSDSQEGFLTQAPPHQFVSPDYLHSQTDVKENLQHLTSQPNPALRGYSQSQTTPLSSRYTIRPGTNLPTSRGNENLDPERYSTASTLKRKNQGSDYPTKITGESSTEAHGPADNANVSVGNNDNNDSGPWRWSKRIRLQDVRIPKDQQELIDRSGSWVPPLGGGSVPQGRVPSNLLNQWNSFHSQLYGEPNQEPVAPKPNESFDNGRHLNGPTSWRWNKQIGLQDVRIPRDQQNLIDNADSWVPPQTGDRMPQGHVPIHLLGQWNGYYIKRNRERQDSSLPAQPMPGASGSQDDNELREGLQSTPSQSSALSWWSATPERSPHGIQLPPDSSPVKQQQAAEVKDSSKHEDGSPSNSLPQMHTKLSNGASQLEVQSWSGGNYTQLPNAELDEPEDESEDSDMDTFVPIPLEYQDEEQEPEMEEEITSSGPRLPTSDSKMSSFTQVKQSPALALSGPHKNGCTSVSGGYQCPTKDLSSNAKTLSDPRVPATYDTADARINNLHMVAGTDSAHNSQKMPTSSYIEEGEVKGPRMDLNRDHDVPMESVSHSNLTFTSQTVPRSTQISETPVFHLNNNLMGTPVSRPPDSKIGPSESQRLKRKREITKSHFETPSKRRRSLGFENPDDIQKSTSSRDTSDSVAQRRRTHLKREHFFRTTQDVYDKFKQCYPDYKGNVEHFTIMCRKLQDLRACGRSKMEKPFLWDDFIIHQTTEYRKYLKTCGDEVKDPASYEEFFLRNFSTPTYKKRSLIHRDLKIVQAEYSDPAAANMRTSTASRPSSNQSHVFIEGPNSTFSASSPKTSSLPTSTAKDAEQIIEESPLEIAETQSQHTPEAVESGNEGDDEDDEDGEDVPIYQDARSTHPEDDDDREIPCTPMEEAHETASIVLGDDGGEKEPHDAQRADSRALEDTFSDHDLGLEDMENVASPETPKAHELPGESAAVPIEIGSSLESKVEKENGIPQESLDLDDEVEINDDDSDESYKDVDSGDERFPDSEDNSDEAEEEEETPAYNKDHSSHPHSARSSPEPAQTTNKKNKSAVGYEQVLSYSESSTSPSPKQPPPPRGKEEPRQKSPAPPAQQIKWHELPNTPFKLFAQSYANLRSELGEQPPTHWTKQSGSSTTDRKPVPVDEEGVPRPPVRDPPPRDDQRSGGGRSFFKSFFKRGQIGWKF